VPALQKRYTYDRIFSTLTWAATFLALLVLLVLLADVFIDGAGRISWQFLSSFPSRRPAASGILSALVGTIWLLSITALISFPVGVGSGIFLEEFAPDNIYTRLVEINIGNLAAVPSIIYGLLGLQVFVRILVPITGGRSVLSGSLTLALLILPVIIVATRESLRSVPNSLRQGGFAVGATRWQVVRDLVLPQAFPGILTGTILALSRAIGETAPLITIGALTFIAFLPPLSLEGLQTPFTALPIQVYNWVSRPQADFHTNAAAGILVLMVVLLAMNATAIFLRNKFQKNRI
jgi:phosphate transport system permease protein